MGEKFLESFGVLLGAFIITVVPELRRWWKNRNSPQLMEDNLAPSIALEVVLGEIGGYIECDRVATYDYHNGVVSTNGIPFHFAFMSSEWTNVGTAKIINTFKNIPVNSFKNLMVRLLSNGDKGAVLADYDKDSLPSSLLTQHAFGIVSSHNFMLGERLGDGTLSIQWNSEADALTETEINMIQSYIYRINLIRKQFKSH